MRKSLLLLAVVGLAATAAGSGTASGASVQIAGHVESDFGLTVTDPEEMLRITAESIAGASPELDAAEARRILDHQLQVDRLIELFLERYPEQYAGAYGEGLGETSVIMVKGTPLGAMRTLVDSYEGVTLRGGAQFSREELIDLTRSLWRVYDDAGHVVSAQMSVRDQRVTIKVATSSATNLIALDAALARAEELMPPPGL